MASRLKYNIFSTIHVAPHNIFTTVEVAAHHRHNITLHQAPHIMHQLLSRTSHAWANVKVSEVLTDIAAKALVHVGVPLRGPGQGGSAEDRGHVIKIGQSQV